MTTSKRVVVAGDEEELARRAADLLASRVRVSAGRFCLALSGGSTPQPLYSRLGSARCRDLIEWSSTHIFFADERSVPPDHGDSNFGMVRELLLSRVALPQGNVHRMRGEASDLDAAAQEYEAELAGICGEGEAGVPSLDLIVLGIGDDGHTASLFPNTAALGVRDRWVVANRVPQLSTARLTLTFPVLAAARGILFLVSGSQKAGVVRRVVEGDLSLPATQAATENATVWLMLDRAAASGLKTPGEPDEEREDQDE